MIPAPRGSNEITTATATTLTGLLKGSGSTVQTAVAGTDYVAPVSGTAGHVVVFGAGGALADSGRAVGEIGGGGGWVRALTSFANYNSTFFPTADQEFPLSKPIRCWTMASSSFDWTFFNVSANPSGHLGFAIMNGKTNWWALYRFQAITARM